MRQRPWGSRHCGDHDVNNNISFGEMVLKKKKKDERRMDRPVSMPVIIERTKLHGLNNKARRHT